MNLIQHLVAFKAEGFGSDLQNKVNHLKIFMKSFKFQNFGIFPSISHFEGFEFLAIGAAKADAGINSSRKLFSKTAIPQTQLAEYMTEIYGKT